MITKAKKTDHQHIPIYCKGCKGKSTWERLPEGDIVSESGNVLWHKWQCSQCHATTIYPSNNFKRNGLKGD